MTSETTQPIRGDRRFAAPKTPRSCAAVLALALLGACGASVPQIDPTTRTSTDPLLSGVLMSFRTGCIENAPAFSESRVRSAFAVNRPSLAPGMMFLATGEAGRSCRVTVRGYGRARPMPTVGDVNRLGRALQARVGGSFKPKKADTGAGGAQVKLGRTTYNVFAYVGKKGDLSLSVFE